MTEREQTISRLNEIADYFHECRSNASFGSKAEEHFWELQSAARDAAEMLKEHEPRLMTLEEINAMNWDYCYAEEEVVKDKHMIELYGEHRIRCITWPSISYYKTLFGSSSYGKRWRCWTQKPTEEQRKAVKWDE